MSVFVDTSAFLAVMVSADQSHRKAAVRWRDLVAGGENLITSNYVVVETVSLLQRRFGQNAARQFIAAVQPVVGVQWVDELLHLEGVASLLASGRKGPSLVDCVSFALMRRRGITSAFAFDRHFKQQGFDCRA